MAATERKRPIEPLTSDEVGSLIAAASRKAPTGIRNRALIAVLYYGGLRLAEALALKPRDIDLDRPRVNVRRGKGHKERKVGIGAPGVPLIERWVAVRRERGLASNGGPLFCTLKGGPLDPRYVRQFLSRYAGKAGIEKRVHPHGLRHSYAAHLAQHDTPVHEIRDQLGHSSLATTGKYLDSIAPEDAIKAVQGAWDSDKPEDEVEALRRQVEALQDAMEKLTQGGG
jgi:site-specific recombinase XerD